MSRVAVVGAGFSGLAVSYFLTSEGQSVTLFDGKGIGGGTSGIASGLLHPYPGELARLSWKGEEGLSETKKLLKLVSQKRGGAVFNGDGILRFAISKEQEQTFQNYATHLRDIDWWRVDRCKKNIHPEIYFPAMLIRSGITVHSLSYLEGLWNLIEEKGGEFVHNNVKIEELSGYDQVVIAAGGGIRLWRELSRLFKFNKGQVLVCPYPKELPQERSLIGKGYMAMSEQKGFCFVGSTYEQHFSDESPCLEKAQEIIFSQVSRFLPPRVGFDAQECFAGIRVVSKKSYLPSVGKVSDRVWLMTGMGSRGLLYHAYLGKKLAFAIIEDNEAVLPKEVLLKS